MNFELKTLAPALLAQDKTDALLVLIHEGFKPGQDALSRLVASVLSSGDLSAKAAQVLEMYRPTDLACKRLVLAHIGTGTPGELRKAVAAGVGALKASKPAGLTVLFANQPEAGQLRLAITALADASYSYTTTLSKPQPRTLETVTLVVPDDQPLRREFAVACAAVQGVELAKEWGNRPANHATPRKLAQAAQALAKLSRVKCKVLEPKDVAKLGMGAFEAVAQGSDEPLRFIELRYNGAGKSAAPTVLVGKGVTFDSGGISIKPASEMDEMKFDMCGAASVLGVFRALAELQPAINVVGLIPACENLPDGRAIKPGDVVTSMSGQTIEILNTDAEGRLILCDALTYAQRFKPRAVIDIATLTGACVIALGAVRSGFFSTDEGLTRDMLAASASSQDLCWSMPLDDDYAEGLKTNFADVANVAGRPGGAITAAKFLQNFAGQTPWGHLDIAGTAWKGGTAKGATGRPVGLLLDYLLAQADAKA